MMKYVRISVFWKAVYHDDDVDDAAGGVADGVAEGAADGPADDVAGADAAAVPSADLPAGSADSVAGPFFAPLPPRKSVTYHPVPLS